MGRVKVKERKKGAHTEEVMREAIKLFRSGSSIRAAAKATNLAYPTVRRYILKSQNDDSATLTPNYAVNAVFSPDEEKGLKEYITNSSLMFYGLTSKDCRRVAYQMAKINDIKIPAVWEKEKMAGKEWLRSFRNRHPDLSLKKPEPCSLGRATAFNQHNVASFFKNLKGVLERHPNFGKGLRIFNLDETSTTTVQRPEKVLAQKGTYVGKITSGERGTLVTTCNIISATGQAFPPVMVFPRKNFKSHMLAGAPTGTLGLATPSGWMNGYLFVEVIKHFITVTGASKENPALLLMDNHESHLAIEALDIAKSSGVTVLTFHPHTTSKLQPLDVGVHGPFKTAYNAAIDSWLFRNPGKPVTIYNIAEFVGQAYLKAMTPSNITNAFKKCGIFPFDDALFTEIDFLPSTVTDRDQSMDESSNQEICTSLPESIASYFATILHKYPTSAPIASCSTNQDPHKMRSATSTASQDYAPNRVLSLKHLALKTVNLNFKLDSPVSSIKPVHLNKIIQMKDSNIMINQPASSQSNSPVNHAKSDHTVPQSKPTTSKMSLDVLECSIIRSTVAGKESTKQGDAKPIKFISPKIFMPPLKAGPRKTKRKRKLGKSVIATDTPEKEELAKTKNTKGAKKIKTDLFQRRTKGKRLTKIKQEDSETSEEEEFNPSGSSSGGEEIVEISEEEGEVLTENFKCLPRLPKEDDYVLVDFTSKKQTVYYVAKILEKLDEDLDYFVSFLRMRSKYTQKFYDPIVPDTAGVKLADIKYLLPQPNISGTTRRHEALHFDVDMSLLNVH